MFDLFVEDRVEDYQWTILFSDACAPASMFTAIVFQNSNDDLLAFGS